MLIIMLSSCIKHYEPEISGSDAVKFVITGQVNRGDNIQRINISKTSSLSESKYLPVTGCKVKILDDKGNIYEAIDQKDGNYITVIPESKLAIGSSFKVEINTPEGINIVSDFDQIHDCPDVDTVYYILDSLPSGNPTIYTKGIQFYTNLNAENTNSHNFRWEAIETYEYHSSFPIEWYYDGTLHHILPPDHSKSVCWRTAPVQDVFTLTTQNLTENKYNMYPFHFVDNVSLPRLLYGYSLLIRQYAISEAAFTYWEKLRINSNEQGGLYEKQPLVIKGNMHNITNPDQKVLGFFGAATVKSKRIFVKKVENLPLEYQSVCTAEGEEPRRGGLKGIPTTFYPAYLYATDYGFSMIILDSKCYDCTLAGGSVTKPDFWPQQ